MAAAVDASASFSIYIIIVLLSKAIFKRYSIIESLSEQLIFWLSKWANQDTAYNSRLSSGDVLSKPRATNGTWYEIGSCIMRYSPQQAANVNMTMP